MIGRLVLFMSTVVLLLVVVGNSDLAMKENVSLSRQREVGRVKAHLAAAEAYLLAADTQHLSCQQQIARRDNLRMLREYRQKGIFPRNLDFPNERRPYFVDDRGVHCAMAYLIVRSGREDLVQRVHGVSNNAFIEDLAGDPEFEEWLHRSGLSLLEAARIQPSYDYSEEPPQITSKYAIASAMVSASSGAAIVLGLSEASPSAWRGVLGLASGAVAIGLGAPKLEDEGDVGRLGVWNVTIGVVSAVVGLRALFQGPGREKALGVRTTRTQVRTLQLSASRGQEAGMQLVLSY